MRIARRLLHALVIVLTLIVGATAAAIIVSQTAWFKNWLRGFIVREANGYLNGKLSIERLGGNLFFGVEMENIGISMDGSEVVAVKDLGLDYNVFELITKGLSVNSIRLDKPVLYLRREGDTWSISRLVKKQQQEADRSGPQKPIAIDTIGISDGSVVVDGPVGTTGVEVPKRIDHLDAKLNFKYEPVRYSIEITHVSFRGSEPEIALNALSGGVAVRDDSIFVDKLALRTAESSVSIDGAVQQYLTKPVFKLQISSDKLSIPEIARVVPALANVRLQPAFEIKADGPLDKLTVDMHVRSSAGLVDGKILADVMAPGQSVNGDITVRHINLAPLLNDPKQKSDITATAKLDLHSASFSNLASLRGAVLVDAPHLVAAGYEADRVKLKADLDGRRVGLTANAAAYGATATAAGHVEVPDLSKRNAKSEPIAFDVHGELRNVDLRRMPRGLNIPPASTHVGADYHVAGTVASGAKTSRMDVKADATFVESTLAGATIAQGSKVGVVMNGSEIGYSADATVSNLDMQRVGREFNVPALDSDRYKSDVNAHITAEGRGTKPAEMNLTANGALTDSTLMGGHIPQLSFDASMVDDTAHVKANGAFADFDPAVASGKPQIKGKVGGSLNVDATVAGVSRGVTVDSVRASAKVDLTPSELGGLALTKANIDADYHDSTGDIRTLDIVGRDINAQASGTLALNDSGQSNLKVHFDSPSLATIGQLANQPLTGIGKVDVNVTGNRTELQVQGNLTGDGVKYGGNGALTLSSNFTAKIPQLDAAKAAVSADTHATFVSIGGQNINELDAKTDYTGRQLTFNATAKQPQRSLSAGGSLLMHPDHQEIHLQSLALQSQGVTWQTAPGSAPAIQYGNVISVKDFKLVSTGNQEIAADGSFGQAGEALKVTLNNIDLATVDALLLRPPQLSGRLNAASTVTGTKDAPAVDATFQINQGGVRQFHYDTFNGKVNYAGRGVTLDAKLQQNPTTWITAKGYVPTAAISAANANPSHAHHESESVPAADRFDVHVDSSPIDLGLIQGFTNQLTNVKGTVQAKIDVSGAADDPHPIGEITLENAAFTAAATGVTYTDVDGKIDLQPDKVHIDSISVLDNQQNPLEISGDLAVHGTEVGGVQIYVNADDFKVIDNKMGNVRINSDLRLTGQLNAPKLEGELGINTGQINLDPILAQTGDSAYATKETEYATTAEDQAGQTKAQPTGFNALTMNVHLTVPDDLVVKGSDLKTPGAAIGLGAINVTLGGDIRVTKDPGKSVRLVGSVKTIRGFYDFQKRRFDILRDGSVRFDGLEELNPTLDIRTERVIQAVTAHVNVRGTLEKPEIVLSSTPPLEQADILSLIVFNQPLNAVGEGQQISLAQRAQAMATGAVAGELAKSIGNALNLNEFEINMAPENGGGPEVTVGQQVGQNLYVKVEQGIGDISQTNFVLEYELTKWLRLRTNVLQGSSTQAQLFQRMQGSGADMLFFFSY
ncbi:MAG TPA: translocation/assembly module TamB domain-containing protein [Vicinamibacterales bacterium]